MRTDWVILDKSEYIHNEKERTDRLTFVEIFGIYFVDRHVQFSIDSTAFLIFPKARGTLQRVSRGPSLQMLPIHHGMFEHPVISILRASAVLPVVKTTDALTNCHRWC